VAVGSRPHKRNKSFPRFTSLHFALIVAMLALLLVGSWWMPMIDVVTLKPDHRFPGWLKALSFYSNIPIKLGVMHAFIYGAELFWDPRSAERHIGQRLTTMWMQFFENPRWGQHFHMQLETVLQLADIADRQVASKTGPYYPTPVRIGFFAVAGLMAFTNLITSCCYHTLTEQLIGAALALFKIVCFDYFGKVEHVNHDIGTTYTDKRALALGVFATATIFFVFVPLLPPAVSGVLHHPTSLATILFVKARGVSSVFAMPRGNA